MPKYEKKLLVKAQYLSEDKEGTKKISMLVGNAYVYPEYTAIKIDRLPINPTGWFFLDKIKDKKMTENEEIIESPKTDTPNNGEEAPF